MPREYRTFRFILGICPYFVCLFDLLGEIHQENKEKSCTGWISEIWKEVQAKILKESLVLVKQTIPQQKALDLSFNLAP